MSPVYRDIVSFLSLIYVMCAVCGFQTDKDTVEDWCNSLEGWNNVVHRNFCYTVHPRALTWSAAVGDCESNGGQLFKAHASDLAHVLFKEGGPLKVWTGAQERGDKFYWRDGISFSFSLLSDAKKWSSEIAAFFSTGPTCLSLELVSKVNFPNGGWWDKDPCSSMFPYVCEHDINDAFKGVSKAANVLPTTMETPDPLLDEGVTPIDHITRTSPGPLTQGTTTMLAKPKRQSEQYRYKSIKHVNRVFNPKLKAKADSLHTETQMTDCARLCSQDNCCRLFNHFPDETCGLYCDKRRATAKGANSVPGARIWVIETF